MKKIIVKVGLSPDVKEMFVGEELKAEKLSGSGIQGALRITGKDNEIMGEFDRYVYWRYVEIPEPDDRLRVLEAAMGQIQAILDDDQEASIIRLDTIHALMNEEKQLELIHEPDKDLMLLNLDYMGSFVELLAPGMDTETLAWAMYAVKQFTEHNLVPGGPCDPGDSEWTWEKFKDSFRPAKILEES